MRSHFHYSEEEGKEGGEGREKEKRGGLALSIQRGKDLNCEGKVTYHWSSQGREAKAGEGGM